MGFNISKAKIAGSLPNSYVSTNEVLALYRDGQVMLSDLTAQDFFELVIAPIKSRVYSYQLEFDMAAKSYLKNNSVLSKMSKTILDPGSQRRVAIEGITNKTLNERKRSTQQMIQTMQKGHALLLDIRQAFTGQTIHTKCLVQTNGRIYAINERYLESSLVLSSFGGGTISNPFSLAYQIDKDLLQTKEFLENAEEITDSEVWQKILSVKLDYSRLYKIPITGNYHFDSTDAEIYEFYEQNKESVASLTVDRYAQLRASMGGGGGYATPFYKMGDVGSVQVKFFNLKQNQSSVTVNFARFSLLRDRFAQLYGILSENNLAMMGQALLRFFTEDEVRVSEGVSTAINNEAKQVFAKIFNL